MAKKLQKQRPKQSAKYTIVQAFDFFFGPQDRDAHEQFNDERGIRAVAFILTYCSQIGNNVVDGYAANGLARILEYCASRIGCDPQPSSHFALLSKETPRG